MINSTDTPENLTYLRAQGLEVVPVPDGYVVYDDGRNMVHYLNPSAAMVLELCGLCVDAAAIARRMQALFDLPAPPDSDVDICLSQLLEQGLVLRGQSGV